MGVKHGLATKGMKTHKDKPTSKLAKQAYVTKPEQRHPNTHNYSLGAAESKVKGLA